MEKYVWMLSKAVIKRAKEKEVEIMNIGHTIDVIHMCLCEIT